MGRSIAILVLAATPALLAVLLAAEPPLSVSPQEGVLLLRNGRVLTGKITREGERFFVALPHGEIRVEAGDVQWSGGSLEDCYRHKRSLLLGGNVNDHLELAAWCITNGLFDAAETELGEAARLDARHPKLPLLDRRLKTLRRGGLTGEGEAKNQPPELAAKEAPPSIEALESLARGLPAGTVEGFTGSIAPMLQNHCATAGCHGPASASSFRLQRLPHQRLVSPRLTLRNLHSTLQMIDRKNPGESALLQAPIKPHGTAKETVFKTRDAAQYRQLVAWVYQVAQAQPPRPDSAGDEQPPLLQADSPSTPRRDQKAPGINALQSAKPKASSSKPAREQSGAPLPGFVPRDPFDPEIFNRRYFPKRKGSDSSAR